MEYTQEQIQAAYAEIQKKAVTKDGRKFYIVKYVHTKLDEWKKNMLAHIEYLQDQLKKGNLIASGPVETGVDDRKEAVLIIAAKDEDDLMEFVKADPFWKLGLVASYTVQEWKPLFRNI